MATSDDEPLTPEALLAIEEASASELVEVLESQPAKDLVALFVQDVSAAGTSGEGAAASDRPWQGGSPRQAIQLGYAALAAFLQANVTGPVLSHTDKIEAALTSAFKSAQDTHAPTSGSSTSKRPLTALRSLCQRSLDTDGVSIYPHVPFIELFCLARFIFTSGQVLPTEESNSLAGLLSWARFRIHLWHYKLLSQPSLVPGSLFTKTGRWTDVASLQERIEQSLAAAAKSVFEVSEWPQTSRVLFCLEEANCHILLGNEAEARQALQAATELSRFTYALSGALGKRTRFQENSVSQLIVLAKSLQISNENGSQASSNATPASLALGDDTLLEKVEFSKEQPADPSDNLPPQLRDLTPETQPELRPEDQIILLTEATLKDTFLPADSLTSEEILPFAARVLEDKSRNWQIYTQALLVRSRIEMNRSRTVERGVLQMQAVVDQVIVDTQEPSNHREDPVTQPISDAPAITVTSGDEPAPSSKTTVPSSFLPAAQSSESAPAKERLRYVNALASPPRWHLESELAHAWTSVGSLVSALEIFKRLRLWPEVALCLASSGAAENENGRGAGGEEKARAVVRWRLFHPTTHTDATSPTDDDADSDDIDISSLKYTDYYGPERLPPPPNAPRLFCLLGDIEDDGHHYERAWEISNKRFARAQRSLGEIYLRNKEWDKAREAYLLAVGVNRLSPEMWSRLGDIELRLGHFPDATEAYQRAISSANDVSGGENARTWSNLGSSLLSWYREVFAEGKARQERLKNDEAENLEDMASTKRASELGRSASQLLRDALLAFKRGATIADSNWRIWDNVVTLAAALTPTPDIDEVIFGVRNIIRIRQTEEALDTDILTLLVREATKTTVADGTGDASATYDPPKGTTANKIVTLFENDIEPLITSNSACWALVSRLRAWRRDWAGALDAAEKGWRTAIGGAGSALSTSSVDGQSGNWLTDPEAWDVVVQRTEELVAAYENYGPQLESIGTRWKGKARSAVRSVMSKAREAWEGDDRWKTLQDLLQDLR
ncbi:hypothetical protein F4780DRAFT_130288 [Xylariomycetidae sp. FL0641]|nr:hypothetical protein F4780DRAFT_130288 [Xylariomycetidae sp. FL0641]